jgi:hypothetical protein
MENALASKDVQGVVKCLRIPPLSLCGSHLIGALLANESQDLDPFPARANCTCPFHEGVSAAMTILEAAINSCFSVLSTKSGFHKHGLFLFSQVDGSDEPFVVLGDERHEIV